LIPERRINGWFPELLEKADCDDEDVDSVAMGELAGLEVDCWTGLAELWTPDGSATSTV
jgi:hypothetical protein